MNKNKIIEGVRLILEGVGEDINREGLIETPERIARMYEEIFSGLNRNSDKELSKTFEVSEDNLVLEKDITFYSLCEHHLVPFYGRAHIAYIPNGRVVGLSKLARCVEINSKKPQIQERLTTEIAEDIMRNLNAKGVMVILEGEHMCMTMRGVKKPGTKTLTSCYRGLFKEDKSLRNEVFNFIK